MDRITGKSKKEKIICVVSAIIAVVVAVGIIVGINVYKDAHRLYTCEVGDVVNCFRSLKSAEKGLQKCIE